MIFVTVGTHEQPFNRLISFIDSLKLNHIIQEDVIIQSGFSTYKPQNCEWSKFLPHEKMVQNVANARIVITHGGPASFILPLQEGKIPVVVPRRHIFHEHVNDHQVDFVKSVAERMRTIIPIYEIDELKNIIKEYENIVESMSFRMNSNNEVFNAKFEEIVKTLV